MVKGQKGITAMNKLFAMGILGLALVIGAATTIEAMTLFSDSATACSTSDC